MTKMDILYNKILGLTMILSVVSIVFLIIDLFYAVTIQAIDCSGQVCMIDHSFPLIRVSVWFFLVLAIIAIVASRIMLQLLSKESDLEDASSYKSRLQNEKESSKLIEAKLKELAEAKQKKEEELELKRLKEKEIKDAKDDLIEKERKEKLIAKARRDEQLKEERLMREKIKKEAMEQEKLEQEKLEQEKLKQEKLEQEKLKQEKLKQEKLEQEKLEQAKQEELVEEESKQEVKEIPEKMVAPKPAKPKEIKKTKADIIQYIEVETGISKNKSNKFLKYFAEVVKETLASGKDVNITGFGKFTTIEMPAKKAMNPQTNKEIIVPAHKQARLRYDDKFKTLVESRVVEEPKVVEDKEIVITPKPVKAKEVKKTKADVIQYIEAETGISKNKSNKFLKYFAEVVKETLASGKDVNIPGFGKFTTIEMPAKKAMNPQTNKEIIVPAHKQARLRFDDKFKEKFEVK